MKKIPLKEVQGAYVVEFDRYEDDRGYFQEIYSTARDYPHLIGTQRQLNLSLSHKGVIRGLHAAPFSKLCSCPRGRLFDVVADVRKNSPTYLKWAGVWLEEQSRRQLFVPANCAHGFFSAEDNTILLYLQDGTYNPELEIEIHWKDPDLKVKWPEAKQYIVSPKDAKAKTLRAINKATQ